MFFFVPKSLAMATTILTMTFTNPGVRAFGIGSSKLRTFRSVSTYVSSTKHQRDRPIAPSFQQQRGIISYSRTATSPLFQSSTPSDGTPSKLVPITLLAGFLGSGKTSTLKHLLENQDGVKVGVIVNDMASVNIDAKLIASSSLDDYHQGYPDADNNNGEAPSALLNGDDTVELQNGCACCSLSDEFLVGIENLLTGRDLDAVVVELSGVADPMAIRSTWEQAQMMGHPATEVANLTKVVTVIDACTFGNDWMSFGMMEEEEECANRKISELLAEQVESADVLLINKIDMAGEEQVKVASAVARGLNDKAALFEVSFGRVSPKVLIDAVEVPKVEEELTLDHSHDHDSKCEDSACTDSSHDHSHDSNDHDSKCEDSACTDSSHDHSHDSNKPDSKCEDSACTDPTHDHSHDSKCADTECTDPTHDHSHDSNTHDATCTDADCTDPTHDHSKTSNTSTDSLGISSFVYKSTFPFQTERLMALLNNWPIPIKDVLDIEEMRNSAKEGYITEDGVLKSPFVTVLRSKGFCWLAPTNWAGQTEDTWRHETAMYWSHAGKHFGITTAGKWWGSIPLDQMEGYFTTNVPEYERILREDFVSEEFSDRRQELVFIGMDLNEEGITEALNGCVCTEEEMVDYRRNMKAYQGITV